MPTRKDSSSSASVGRVILCKELVPIGDDVFGYLKSSHKGDRWHWPRVGRIGQKVFEGRAAIEYDYGYDAQKFYLGLALDPKYIEGFIEGCWRGSVKTSRRMKPYSGTSGRTRARGRRCL